MTRTRKEVYERHAPRHLEYMRQYRLDKPETMQKWIEKNPEYTRKTRQILCANCNRIKVFENNECANNGAHRHRLNKTEVA